MTEVNLPEEVHNWLFYAEEDYQSAEIMFRERFYNKVCFFSQQCVEKILKAYLLFHQQPLLRTHKIVDLLSCATQKGIVFKQFEEEALALDRYYIPTRYPDAVIGSLPEGLPGKSHAAEAKEAAFRILEFVKSKLLP